MTGGLDTQDSSWEQLLLDPDLDKKELEKVLDDAGFCTLDLDVEFRGEIIRSEQSFHQKLESIFDGVCFTSLKVTRAGPKFIYKAVVNKENFLLLIKHGSYGSFPGDYRFSVVRFQESCGDEEIGFNSPDTPPCSRPLSNRAYNEKRRS